MLEILAVIAIVGYIVGRQLIGEPLRGKRVVLLPAVLAVIGFADLTSHGRHLRTADVVCLMISAVIAAAIGAGQASMMRLESRNGALWGPDAAAQPVAVARPAGVARADDADRVGVHAHVAASTAPILLMLGVNRLAQGGVVLYRALAAGIPFAPEKDGRTFLSGLSDSAAVDHDRRAGTRGGGH
jgi:hypothetical protein